MSTQIQFNGLTDNCDFAKCMCDTFNIITSVLSPHYYLGCMPDLYNLISWKNRGTIYPAPGVDTPNLNGIKYMPTHLPSLYKQENYRKPISSSGAAFAEDINPCVFSSVTFGTPTFNPRICGSRTLDCDGMGDTSIRSYCGGILQSNICVKELCCELDFLNTFAGRIELALSTAEGIKLAATTILTEAIFAPVHEKVGNQLSKYVSLKEDVGDRLLDLSGAGGLDIGNIMGKFSNVLFKGHCLPAGDYTWLVPQSIFAWIIGHMNYSGCCQPLIKRDGLSNAYLFPNGMWLMALDDKYFNKVGGKFETVIINNRAIIAEFIMPNIGEYKGGAGTNRLSIFHVITEILNRIYGQSFFQTNALWLEDRYTPNYNWNSLITIMWGLVAGRADARNMWIVTVDENPTVAPVVTASADVPFIGLPTNTRELEAHVALGASTVEAAPVTNNKK